MNAAKNKLELEIDQIKELINLQKNEEAITVLDNYKLTIEEYADSYSKNQNIKKESIKRNERKEKKLKEPWVEWRLKEYFNTRWMTPLRSHTMC